MQCLWKLRRFLEAVWLWRALMVKLVTFQSQIQHPNLRSHAPSGLLFGGLVIFWLVLNELPLKFVCFSISIHTFIHTSSNYFSSTGPFGGKEVFSGRFQGYESIADSLLCCVFINPFCSLSPYILWAICRCHCLGVEQRCWYQDFGHAGWARR